MSAHDRGASRLPIVLRAGLAAGVMDITAAFITWAPRGVTPVDILQGIASGLLGPTAFEGGWKTAALGGLLHFFIALSAAAVFYVLSRRLGVLTRRPILAGVVYGVAVYFVMYWIVMPLSRFHPRTFSWSAAAIAVVTHIVCVGTPISLVVSRYSRRPDLANPHFRT